MNTVCIRSRDPFSISFCFALTDGSQIAFLSFNPIIGIYVAHRACNGSNVLLSFVIHYRHLAGALQHPERRTTTRKSQVQE